MDDARREDKIILHTKVDRPKAARSVRQEVGKMRKMVLLAAMMAMAVMMLAAAPAMADDWDWNDDFDDHGFFFGDFDQEAESGDVDQSFDVSNTGDNSNQTAGIQGVANTGNAQNQIGVFDAGNGFDGNDFFGDDNRFFFDDDDNRFFFDDNRFFGDDDGHFEFDNVGSSIEVSPTNTTSSNQRVNQAASASD
jgi:hypothetical protein